MVCRPIGPVWYPPPAPPVDVGGGASGRLVLVLAPLLCPRPPLWVWVVGGVARRVEEKERERERENETGGESPPPVGVGGVWGGLARERERERAKERGRESGEREEREEEWERKRAKLKENWAKRKS